MSWFWHSVRHSLITHCSVSHYQITLTWLIQRLILHLITCANLGSLFFYRYSPVCMCRCFCFLGLCGDVLLKRCGSDSKCAVQPLHAMSSYTMIVNMERDPSCRDSQISRKHDMETLCFDQKSKVSFAATRLLKQRYRLWVTLCSLILLSKWPVWICVATCSIGWFQRTAGVWWVRLCVLRCLIKMVALLPGRANLLQSWTFSTV